ncbi:MAG: hypothetical protein IKM43_03705 [Clostridia bacterium]|nr:hypothetical protein [Clostridia bacterium]
MVEPGNTYAYVRNFLEQKNVNYIKVTRFIIQLLKLNFDSDEIFLLDKDCLYPEICDWIVKNIDSVKELYRSKDFSIDDKIEGLTNFDKFDKCKIQLVSDIMVTNPENLLLLNDEYCTAEVVAIIKEKCLAQFKKGTSKDAKNDELNQDDVEQVLQQKKLIKLSLNKLNQKVAEKEQTVTK